jgi:hypothetical protein
MSSRPRPFTPLLLAPVGPRVPTPLLLPWLFSGTRTSLRPSTTRSLFLASHLWINLLYHHISAAIAFHALKRVELELAPLGMLASGINAADQNAAAHIAGDYRLLPLKRNRARV